MNVRELRQTLKEARDILAAAGSKAPTRDFDKFLTLLEGHDEQLVDEFLTDLRERLDQRASPTRMMPSPLNEVCVKRYVKMLGDLGTDRAAFEVVYAEIKADKAVRKQEADAIAYGYKGGRKTWPTKGKAIKAIEDWFEHMAFDAVKMRQVDKV